MTGTQLIQSMIYSILHHILYRSLSGFSRCGSWGQHIQSTAHHARNSHCNRLGICLPSRRFSTSLSGNSHNSLQMMPGSGSNWQHMQGSYRLYSSNIPLSYTGRRYSDHQNSDQNSNQPCIEYNYHCFHSSSSARQSRVGMRSGRCRGNSPIYRRSSCQQDRPCSSSPSRPHRRNQM